MNLKLCSIDLLLWRSVGMCIVTSCLPDLRIPSAWFWARSVWRYSMRTTLTVHDDYFDALIYYTLLQRLCSALSLLVLCTLVTRLWDFQFSSVPWPIGSPVGYYRRFSRDPLPVFSAGGPCKQFWHRQGHPLFDVVHQAFPLPTRASPTLQSWRMVLGRLSWRVTCLNHASLRLSEN